MNQQALLEFLKLNCLGRDNGYFWPSEPSEAIETYRQMSRRAANIRRTLNNIKEAEKHGQY